MTFVGIDPGVNGYLCELDGSLAARLTPSATVRFFPAPTIESGKGRQVYDLKDMMHILASIASRGVELAVIEKQQPFPKQGGVSNFSTGYGYGAWKAALTAAKIPFEEVAPATWKKAFGIAGASDPKKAKCLSVEKAQSMFPRIDFKASERTKNPRVPCPDKAEALLLAVHASRLRAGVGAVA